MLMFLIYILSFTVSFNQLPTEIKDRLKMEFSNYERVEFEVLKAPKELNNIHLKKDEKINVIGSNAYVPIYTIDSRGNKKRTTITVRVRLYDKVYVSTKEIEKRAPINVSDFELAEKEVTSVRGKIVLSLGEVIGSRAGRHISKGDILTSESLEKMPVIFPGDKVSAASIVGNVQITFSAFAKQEGCIGDIIRIRTKDKKVYKAEVIDYKNVLIVE